MYQVGEMSLWSEHVVPFLVEKACRSSAILEERRRWVPRARGNVLELGVGSGLNFAFYDRERATHVTGIDPSEALLERARKRADDASVPVSLVHASAEAMPFSDRSFDSAIVTYSLCSVSEPARALAEVRRVLRPNGELFFVEHGLAPDPGTRRWQHRITPIWRRIGGGCHLDRDHVDILRCAGFSLEELATGYTDGARLLSYTYAGVARPI